MQRHFLVGTLSLLYDITGSTCVFFRVNIHVRPTKTGSKHFTDWAMALIVDKDNKAILAQAEGNTNYPLVKKPKYGKKAKPCGA